MRSQQHSGTVGRSESGLFTGTIDSLEEYKYSSLVGQEIRVLDLLPGEGDEEVRIRIRHCPLREPPSKEDPRMSLNTLRETLPQGWHAYETIDSRYLFLQRNLETHDWTNSTWRHPDAAYDASKYEQVSVAGEYEEEDMERTKFEAISYTWGQPEKEPLYVRVESSSQHFKLGVWPNLISMLRHLRLRNPSASRTMWVDAICLNQKDHVEKGLQIPRMRDIYRLAYRTIVWLGPQCDATGLAFELVERIASHVEISFDGSLKAFPSPGSVEKWYGAGKELPSLPEDAWEALASLLGLSWFRRLWVVQEVQLSNHTGPRGSLMYWGSHTIARSKLCRAVSWVFNKYQDGWPLLQIVNTGVKLEQHVPLAMQLLQPRNGARLPGLRRLFRAHVKRDCGDERDKVYGLLGLAGPRFSEEIKVSYEDIYGAADVNRDVVLTHIRLSHRLELLDPHGPSHRKVLVDAPSWVPEWSGSAGVSYSIEPIFPANNTRAHIKHEKDHPDILHVLGVQCAVIDEVTESLEWSVTEKPWKALRHVQSWQPHDLNTAIYTPTGEKMRQAYAVTIIQADVDVRWPHEDTPSLQQWAEQDYTHALFGPTSLAQDSAKGPPLSTLSLHHHVVTALQYCTGRRFFQTREGYMGIANRDTQKGDIVATLLGCVTPVVLRPVHNTDGQLKFFWIGECFVHGLHDSTRLLGPFPAPWKGILENYGGGRTRLRFQNTETGEETWQDPRLPPLEEWEGFWPEKMEQYDPMDPIFLRHRDTGEEITYDPRLEPEHLEARGVELTWFTLV